MDLRATVTILQRALASGSGPKTKALHANAMLSCHTSSVFAEETYLRREADVAAAHESLISIAGASVFGYADSVAVLLPIGTL